MPRLEMQDEPRLGVHERGKMPRAVLRDGDGFDVIAVRAPERRPVVGGAEVEAQEVRRLSEAVVQDAEG